MNFLSKKIFVETFLVLGLFFVVSSCSDDPNETKLQYMPDMADAPTVKAQEDYIDPPENSVHTRAILYPEKVETAEAEFKNPLPANQQTLAAGKKHYAAFCAVCHGVLGKGKGSLTKAYIAPVPDITRDDLKQRKDGFFFVKISMGGAMMPSYGHAIDPKERWEIIHHLRTLQKK